MFFVVVCCVSYLFVIVLHHFVCDETWWFWMGCSCVSNTDLNLKKKTNKFK